MNELLEQIEARAKDLTDLCPDHLRQGIRHLQRNCDMECPVHDEEAKWYDCNQPDRYDGGRMAEALSDIPTLLALVQKQQAALDELMYVANHKAADTAMGQWWAEVIRGPIIQHLGAEEASKLGAMKDQAYIVECEDLEPGDQIWFSSLFEAEQTCGPFPSCCVPKPVGDDYDGPKWVPEDDGAALTATEES